MKGHRYSVRVDLRKISEWAKDLKLIADIIRSGIKNKHGFAALKGLTDLRFARWPIAVRFKASDSRANIYGRMHRLLHPDIIALIGLKLTSPDAGRLQSIRYLRS